MRACACVAREAQPARHGDKGWCEKRAVPAPQYRAPGTDHSACTRRGHARPGDPQAGRSLLDGIMASVCSGAGAGDITSRPPTLSGDSKSEVWEVEAAGASAPATGISEICWSTISPQDSTLRGGPPESGEDGSMTGSTRAHLRVPGAAVRLQRVNGINAGERWGSTTRGATSQHCTHMFVRCSGEHSCCQTVPPSHTTHPPFRARTAKA